MNKKLKKKKTLKYHQKKKFLRLPEVVIQMIHHNNISQNLNGNSFFFLHLLSHDMPWRKEQMEMLPFSKKKEKRTL